MGIEIRYGGELIADLMPGVLATLPCAGQVMTGDLEVAVPAGDTGAEERDFHIVACYTRSKYSNSKTPLIRYASRVQGSGATNYKFYQFSPAVSNATYNVFAKIPKGHEVYFTYTASSTGDFRYFKSDMLGFELTALGANTGWLAINGDVTDLECYAEGTPSDED